MFAYNPLRPTVNAPSEINVTLPSGNSINLDYAQHTHYTQYRVKLSIVAPLGVKNRISLC